MQTETIELRELTVKYSVRKDGEGRAVVVGRNLAVPRDAAEVFRQMLADEPTEVFAMLCLSAKLRVIAYHEVSRGTLDATLVHPREVFKVALLANAYTIVISHNHPSGDPTPSEDDKILTRQLAAAGQILGVSVLDHIIIGHDSYVCFSEMGLL